jgi:hypothetical protein
MPLLTPLPPLKARWIDDPGGTPTLVLRQYMLALDADIRSLDGTPGQIATINGQITTINSQIAAINAKLAAGQVSSSVLVATPTGTASATGVMMGLAGAITPTASGKVLLIACGVVGASSGPVTASWQLRFGPGGAPANGAALIGTITGSLMSAQLPAAASRFPFSLQAILTGLALSTAVWLDLSLAVTGGATASLTQVNVSAHEL